MDFSDRLKSEIDIVSLVQEYVPTLRKSGPLRWFGLCPFHSERTPSFSVHEGEQFFKCFGGCGKGGDAYEFIMQIEGVSFPGAVKILANRAGIPVEGSEEWKRIRAMIEKERAIQEWRDELVAQVKDILGAYAWGIDNCRLKIVNHPGTILAKAAATIMERLEEERWIPMELLDQLTSLGARGLIEYYDGRHLLGRHELKGLAKHLCDRNLPDYRMLLAEYRQHLDAQVKSEIKEWLDSPAEVPIDNH